MMNQSVFGQLRAGILGSLLIGCHAAVEAPPVAFPLNAERHRPEWLTRLEPHLADIRACLVGKLPPSGVVFLPSLANANGVTGVTSIDGLGDTEHCTAQGGEVVHREVGSKHALDLVGSAVFTPERPVVRPLELVEEVIAGERSIGFVYWLSGWSDHAVVLDASAGLVLPDAAREDAHETD